MLSLALTLISISYNCGFVTAVVEEFVSEGKQSQGHCYDSELDWKISFPGPCSAPLFQETFAGVTFVSIYQLQEYRTGVFIMSVPEAKTPLEVVVVG